MKDIIDYSKMPFAAMGRRVLATSLDAIVVIPLIFLIGLITSFFPENLGAVKVVLFYSPILFYNPVMISIFGNTIFQKFFKIKVVREDGRYCPFYIAMLRWVVEILLGWISIAYFLFNDKHQTIHDKVAGTFVYYLQEKNQNEDIDDKAPGEKVIYEYPAAGRRFLFFFIWYIPSSLIVGFFLGIILTIAGINIEAETSEKYYNLVSILLFVLIIILAAKGFLPGAKKKRIVCSEVEE